MINRLRKKIFWVIFVTLSIIIIGAIGIFAFINYRNITFFGDRAFREKPEGEGPPEMSSEERLEPPANFDDLEEVKQQFQEYAQSRLRILAIVSVSGSMIGLVVVYVISRKVSNLIVKPVEETFSKQVQFISDASHELKTPLAVIEANSDVLENEVGENKWLKYIQNETQNMDKLINELLLLAKIENVDSIKEYETFDLSQEAEMSSSVFESMAYEKEVEIKTNIQENVKFNGNRQDLGHIFSVLIDNAIKHSLPKKEVIVDLKKEKEGIILKVSNYGEEIPKEEQDKIFERFYRVDKSRNRNEKRYGLGLAIAKSIVLKYKGEITVDCKEGITTFKVKLPVNKGDAP